jgi:hypothetical protein
METENKEENKMEQEKSEPQQQKEDNPDNFSDQEIEDDFYKIQIENFKNKTTSNFHKNIQLINEKGRVIRSARFTYLHDNKFHKEKEEIKPKDENISKQQTTQEPNKVVLNNSSGQVENSTTLL